MRARKKIVNTEQRLFERPNTSGQAALIHVDVDGQDLGYDCNELTELVVSAGFKVATTVIARRAIPDPAYFVGQGKVDEIHATILEQGADVVVFNYPLSPIQERNLERRLNCRVTDRTGIILDIFARRASTFEGKLQVGLAQLQYMSTRLVRGWTHLERQRGGIGLRGPGETQLESDRRLIKKRIKHTQIRLEKVREQRVLGRRARRKASLPQITLVGYTNAGKSTLFNLLTHSAVHAADALFVTLDPTSRKTRIAGLGETIVSDTVGFIRHLPHDLVAAFRATLEEVKEADLLLHVIDATSDQRDSKIEEVNRVLCEIGAEQVPQIKVYNKIDLIADTTPRIEQDTPSGLPRVWLSSKTREGINLLELAIAEYFRQTQITCRLLLPGTGGRLRARLYAMGAVREESIDDDGSWLLQVQIPKSQFDQLCENEQLDSLMVGSALAPVTVEQFSIHNHSESR
jgi:GTP-binding protein HflX